MSVAALIGFADDKKQGRLSLVFGQDGLLLKDAKCA